MRKATHEGKGKMLSIAHSSSALASGTVSATAPVHPPRMAPTTAPSGPPNARPNKPPPMKPSGTLEPGAGIGTVPLSST